MDPRLANIPLDVFEVAQSFYEIRGTQIISCDAQKWGIKMDHASIAEYREGFLDGIAGNEEPKLILRCPMSTVRRIGWHDGARVRTVYMGSDDSNEQSETDQ